MSQARIPPHNLEAERALLGALLVEPERVAETVEKLSSEDFFDPRHAALFEAVSTLASRGVAVDDIDAVIDALEQFRQGGDRGPLNDTEVLTVDQDADGHEVMGYDEAGGTSSPLLHHLRG